MKKHIIGLALFSFIVSAAAVVYALFNIPEIVPVYEVISVPSPQDVPVKRTNCKLRVKSKINSIEIRQAVFNAQTEQFDLELDVSEDIGAVALHFFSKNNSGTRYVETVQIGSGSDKGKVKLGIEAFERLNKSKSDGNLFVMAESIAEYLFVNSENQPKFDSQRAVAVTVDYGK